MLQQGRIIRAMVRDPNGQNPKIRPAVIVTATEEILPGQPFAAVAITGTLPNPLTSEYVELPWHRNGLAKTGLTKRCAANCLWLCAVQEADVLQYAGVVPNAELLEILSRIPRPLQQANPPKPPPPASSS